VAANKSKSTAQIFVGKILWENKLLESYKLNSNTEISAANRKATSELVDQLVDLENNGSISRKATQGKYLSWTDVPLDVVRAFVGKFRASPSSDFFSSSDGIRPSAVFESLSEIKGSDSWTISLISGDSTYSHKITNEVEIHPSIRNTIDFEDSSSGENIHFLNRKVTTASNLASTLSPSELAEIISLRSETVDDSSLSHVRQNEVLAHIQNPSLMIYHVTGTNEHQNPRPERVLTVDPSTPLVAIAIAYPKLDPAEAADAASKAKKYTANSVDIRIRFGSGEDTDDVTIDDKNED
jgi:hypothetical protein